MSSGGLVLDPQGHRGWEQLFIAPRESRFRFHSKNAMFTTLASNSAKQTIGELKRSGTTAARSGRCSHPAGDPLYLQELPLPGKPASFAVPVFFGATLANQVNARMISTPTSVQKPAVNKNATIQNAAATERSRLVNPACMVSPPMKLRSKHNAHDLRSYKALICTLSTPPFRETGIAAGLAVEFRFGDVGDADGRDALALRHAGLIGDLF